MIIFKVIELKLYLSYMQFHHIQTPRLLDVDAIYAIKGIDDGLSSIGDDRVAHALRDNLNTHSGFNANAVGLLAVLRGDLKYCHNAKVLYFWLVLTWCQSYVMTSLSSRRSILLPSGCKYTNILRQNLSET